MSDRQSYGTGGARLKNNFRFEGECVPNSEVIYRKVGKVAEILLNRPARINALNQNLIRKLGQAFTEAEQEPAVGCILLSGAGSGFSSGGDLEMLDRLTKCTAAEVHESAQKDFALMLNVYSVGKPLITAVNGVALGGGCSLALCGDIILASDRARFGMTFSRFNLGPDMGASFLLPRLVGLLRAKELIYSGRIISAEEALSYGMVSEVCPHEQLMETAMNKAHQMAQGATQAIVMAKKLLHRSTGIHEMASALDLEAKAQAILLTSEGTKKKLRAFLKNHRSEVRTQSRAITTLNQKGLKKNG
jgi:2-(1,2-epoxy-1,2-dihydrophenyl)acetyl-CoA isomerase